MITAAVVHLIAVSRRMKNRKHAIRPFLCMLLIPLLTTINKILVAAKLPQASLSSEILIFCMIGVQEFCIRNRLLPHNENYADFFARTELPVSITDKELSPVYRTAIPVTAEPEQRRQAVGSFVYPDPNTRLSGMELQGGYAFFVEDESVLRRLNEELEDANEILSMENELLAHEQCLVITQNGKRRLLSGCAHNGILNILDRYKELFGSEPDCVISGFHMMKRDGAHTAEEKAVIIQTAQELSQMKTVFYSGHCTGIPAFEMMKEIMGEKLIALHSGEAVIS